MGISDTEILDIVNIIYYVPALALGLFVCRKHGFTRSLGWTEIVILSIIRIVGSALGIAAVAQSNLSLAETAATLNSIGLRFLLAAVLALLRRADQTKTKSPLLQRAFGLLQVVLIVAVVLTIVGVVQISNNDPGTSHDSSGWTIYKAGSILYLVAFLAVAAMSLWSLANIRAVYGREKMLVYASVATMPFLAVRVIYSLALAFAPAGSDHFNLFNPDILVKALMSNLEEYISVIIILVTGLAVPASRNAGQQMPAQNEPSQQDGYSHYKTTHGNRDTVQTFRQQRFDSRV